MIYQLAQSIVGTQEKWANQNDSPICSTSRLDLFVNGLKLGSVWLLLNYDKADLSPSLYLSLLSSNSSSMAFTA